MCVMWYTIKLASILIPHTYNSFLWTFHLWLFNMTKSERQRWKMMLKIPNHFEYIHMDIYVTLFCISVDKLIIDLCTEKFKTNFFLYLFSFFFKFNSAPMQNCMHRMRFPIKCSSYRSINVSVTYQHNHH